MMDSIYNKLGWMVMMGLRNDKIVETTQESSNKTPSFWLYLSLITITSIVIYALYKSSGKKGKVRDEQVSNPTDIDAIRRTIEDYFESYQKYQGYYYLLYIYRLQFNLPKDSIKSKLTEPIFVGMAIDLNKEWDLAEEKIALDEIKTMVVGIAGEGRNLSETESIEFLKRYFDIKGRIEVIEDIESMIDEEHRKDYDDEYKKQKENLRKHLNRVND